MFDLSEPATFVSVKKWLQEIANHCDEVPRVLVGNKLDAPNRVVEKAGKFSNKNQIRAKNIGFLDFSFKLSKPEVKDLETGNRRNMSHTAMNYDS